MKTKDCDFVLSWKYNQKATENITEFTSNLMDNDANLTSYEKQYKINLVKLNVIEQYSWDKTWQYNLSANIYNREEEIL